jgi:hypothetical protein
VSITGDYDTGFWVAFLLDPISKPVMKRKNGTKTGSPSIVIKPIGLAQKKPISVRKETNRILSIAFSIPKNLIENKLLTQNKVVQSNQNKTIKAGLPTLPIMKSAKDPDVKLPISKNKVNVQSFFNVISIQVEKVKTSRKGSFMGHF